MYNGTIQNSKLEGFFSFFIKERPLGQKRISFHESFWKSLSINKKKKKKKKKTSGGK